MVENHLLELLKEHNRVIIPDLGAFNCNRQGEKSVVSFNDFLKFNDGLLVNHLVKTEKISKTEATEQIRLFVKTIEKDLRDNKQSEIVGIGHFYKDEKSSVCFAGEFSFLENDIAPIPDQGLKNNTETTITLDQTVPEEKSNNDNKQTSKIPEPVFIPRDEPSNYNTKTSIQNKTTNNYKPNENKRFMQNSTKIIIIISIVLVVIAGGIFGLVYFDVLSTDTLMFWKKKTEIVQAPIIEPQVVEAPPVPEPPAAPEQQVVDLKNKYHVVAGSFKVESNAIKFSEKLKGQGFQSNIVGPRNGYYIVTYATFDGKKDAIAEYNKMKQDQANVWVLHY